MSKIGKRIINIPSNVFVNFIGNTFTITGVLGSFTFTIHSSLSVLIFCNFLSIFFKEKIKLSYRERAYFGTVQSILSSAIIGVCIGFRKRLLLNGIGYKANLSDLMLVLRVGHSHKIEYLIPANLKVSIENFTIINVFGVDKQAVGQFASSILKFRPTDSYKGKGISYDGVSVKLKEVKKK